MKNNFLIAFMCLTTFLSFGQNLEENQSHTNKKEFRAMHDAFIIRELDLSVSESQEFWSVYNEYIKKMEEHKMMKRDVLRGAKNEEDTNYEELLKTYEELLKTLDTLGEAELRLKTEYHQKLIPIIGAKRVIQLERSEREFKRHLLHQIRDKRTNRIPQH